MKIKETLSSADKRQLFLNQTAVGLFEHIFRDTDPFFDLNYSLCLGYYTVRSANKTVSTIYEQMYETFKELAIEDGHTDILRMTIDMTNEYIGASLIRPKFIDKWTRIYNLLLSNEYDPLKNFEYTEHKDGNNSDTTTYASGVAKVGDNSDTTIYNSNTEDNGNTATHEVTTSTKTNENDVYGFNSAQPVGNDKDTEKTQESLIGTADGNTTHNIQTKTGTDTKNFVISENETKSGTDTKNLSIDEDITKSGRNDIGASLIEAELSLRNTQIFYDIVYRDIDSIATIPLYI